MNPHVRPPKMSMFFLVVVFVTFAAFASANEANNPSILEAELTSLKLSENIGAIAYGIVSAEEIISAAALGSYSRDEERRVDLDSLFRIGSISKTFTALGALILEQKSDLKLSAPAANYISSPPYTNLWRAKYPMTSAQLLEHTAGFRDMTRKEFDHPNPLSLKEAFALEPKSRITAWPPGQHSSYSNSGAGVMTAIIEAVSGETFSQFMAVNVFRPLALRSASFSPPAKMYKDLVRGYDSDGVSPLPYWHQLYPAFGGLNISTNDMLRFTQFLLNDGKLDGKQLLRPGLIGAMPYPTASLAARAGLRYGYGKGLYQFQHKGIPFAGHGGDADGYLAFLAYSPLLNRGYFVVINAYKQTSLKKIRVLIQDYLVGDTKVIFPGLFSLSEDATRTLLGEYEEVTTRFPSNRPARRMMISQDDSEGLYTRIDDSAPKPLLPVSGHLFRRKQQSIATIALIRSDGEIYLQGDFGNFKKTLPES